MNLLFGVSQPKMSWLKILLQATIALLKDGTIAVEVSTSLTLVQWPFLTDISLAWAAASIFEPCLAETEDSPCAASQEIETVLADAEFGPWLYINCILRDSQLFIPVADPVSTPRWPLLFHGKSSVSPHFCHLYCTARPAPLKYNLAILA